MDNICIPMHLDAFALSPGCCDEKLVSRIAPYTQPNYTALRLDSHLIQHDVLDHTDFHNTQPAAKNPRIADIGSVDSNNLKLHRMGVHLQWSLPRLYRTATASGRDSTLSAATGTDDPTQPVFKQIPNRWLITRHLKTPQRPRGMDEFQSWVVESNAVQTIKNIPADTDLESGVSPFVSYDGDPNAPSVLDAQTEVFVGQKFDLAAWPGTGGTDHLKNMTVMTSSNPLFGDYALHNVNVLSVIDNFSYPLDSNNKVNPNDNKFSYLAVAQCDYFVVGWHQDSSQDPLNTSGVALDSRLTKLMLKLNKKFSDLPAGDPGTIKNGTAETRCLVHGAIYDVKYDFNRRPRSLAEDSALKFTSHTDMEPLSIGTTPLDGILTFLEAHKDDKDDVNAFGAGGSDLSQKVVELGQLLYAAADQYDSRVQAQDLIAQQNYAKSDGGSHWTFSTGSSGNNKFPSKNDGKPKIPTANQQEKLRNINELQSQLDIAIRKLPSLRWELFAEWFKYKSEFIKDTDLTQTRDRYKAIVDPLKQAINDLAGRVTDLKSQVQDLQKQVDCKVAPKDPYKTRLDPTLCIAGLDSGWPSDVMDTLQVRLHSELTNNVAEIAAVDAIFASTSNGRPKTTNPVPQDHDLQSTAKKILAECLRDANVSTVNGKVDGVAPVITGFQAWGERNPFAPLFIEWESMYYHIDWKSWDVQLRASPVGHAHPQIRYAPKELLVSTDKVKAQQNATTNQNDFRTLSGRVLVLPQPRLSLESVVLQVLDSKSSDVPFDDKTKDDIKSKIRQIKFISAPLSGLTNHLLTRCEGAHVKPNVRTQGQKVIALKAADANEIDMDYLHTLPLVDSESALTPYGSLMAFGLDDYPHNPFKPVMHGQMVLTKLNIIDKFGQAVCLPAQRRRKVNQTQPPDAKIYPCLSDYLAPNVIKASPDDKTGVLNTVFPTTDAVVDGKWPLCPFVQLTPSINQDARINAAFLKQDALKSPWREVSEYESPIWGWIVINYADNGLQFFLGDGRFYREIRRGGVHGTNTSVKWLPYGPPDKDKGLSGFSPNDPGVVQLDQLIQLFTAPKDGDASYLIAFSNMINGAIQNMPFAPSSYAGYANAIVGKPLALVNVGWSIELAEPPVKPQFDSVDTRPDIDQWKGQLESYAFPLKIGDYERNYDGVVAYYKVSPSESDPPGQSVPPPPSVIWDNLYTYFMPKDPNTKFSELVPDNYLQLKPYYIHPEPDVTPRMVEARNKKYTVTSLLMDPYTPIHAYSPILPIKSLTLPPWSVQEAMDKMHAFFRLGPCLVTNDVPLTYDAANAVKPDGTPKEAVRLPVSGRKGTWTWLQPYAQDGFDDDGNEKVPHFATMDVQEDLGQTKFEPAPYTFLEGYLQLMGRLDNKGDGLKQS